MIIVFSFFTPVGILIGIYLSDFRSRVIEGIFLSISAGTFIYVAASEVIVEEFSESKFKYQKFFAFLMGGISMAGLSIFEKLHNFENLQ